MDAGRDKKVTENDYGLLLLKKYEFFTEKFVEVEEGVRQESGGGAGEEQE